MSNTTETFWSVDGVSLQTYAFNISTWGGDAQSVPTFRGDDLVVPFSPGEVWLDKVPESRTISFGMWVIGANEDGTLPAEGSSRELFEKNWNALKKLLWTPHRQVNLTKRFKDWTTGEVITATAKAQFAGGLQPTMNGTQRAQFTVQFKLTDPFFYGDEKKLEISPYDVAFTNNVRVASPYTSLNGYGYTIDSSIGNLGVADFSRQSAFRKTPPTGAVNVDRARPDNSFAKLIYTNEMPPAEGGIVNGPASSTFVDVTPGDVLKFSARVLLTNRSNSMRIRVSFYDNTGAVVGTTVYGNATTVPKAAGAPETVDISPSQWTKLSVTNVTVPAGAVRASIAVVRDIATGVAWQELRTNYALDPSFEGAGVVSEYARNKFKNPVFSGVPTTPPTNILFTNYALNPEFSTTSGELTTGVNWAPNPSFEPGTLDGWTFQVLAGTVTRSLKSGGAYAGSYYQAFNSTGATANARAATSTKVGLPIGDVTFSLYVRGVSANATMYLSERSGATFIGTATATPVALTSNTSWVRLSVTLPKTRVDTYMQAYIDITANGAALNNVGIDGAMIETGVTTPTPYFDYNSTPSDIVYYKRVSPSPTGSSTSSGGLISGSSSQSYTTGETVRYCKLPRNVKALSSGVRAVQSALPTAPGRFATALALETLVPGESASDGAQLYVVTQADVGKTLTVLGTVTVPAGYSAAQDYTTEAAPRGIYIKGNLAAGYAQASASPGTTLLRAYIKPTAAGQIIRFGGGGLAGTILKLEKLTIVKHRYEGPQFSGDYLTTGDGGNIGYSWAGTIGDSVSYAKGIIPTGVYKTADYQYDIQFHRTVNQGGAVPGPYGLKIIRTGDNGSAAVGVSIGTFPAGRYILRATARIPSGYDASEDYTATAEIAPRAIGTFATTRAPNSKYFQLDTTPGVKTIGGTIDLTNADEIRLSGGGLQGQSIDWLSVTLIPQPNTTIDNEPLVTAGFNGDTAGTSDVKFSWAGTPHNSESVMSVVAGFGNPTSTTNTDPMPVIQATGSLGTGTKYITGIPRTTNPEYAVMQFNPAWLPRKAGTYTLYAKISTIGISGTPAANAMKFMLTAPDVFLTSPEIPSGTQTVRWTFTLDSDVSSWTKFNFKFGYSNGFVYLDDFVITEGTYTGGYFDGNTAGSKWNGAAQASTSSRIPDVIYANKFAATKNNAPYDFFTGYGLDTIDGSPSTQYYYGWRGIAGNSVSEMYLPVTTPYTFEVPGDYITKKVRFVANAPLGSFTLRNTRADGVTTMTYGVGTTNGVASVDVENFRAFSGVQRTSAFVDHTGHYFWFPLYPGQNNILTSGLGIGNLDMYYRPAWL